MRKMKTFICALLSALLFIACAACNNNKQSDSVTDTAGGSSGGGNTSTTESQGLPDGIIDTGIDDAYLPVVSDIKKYSGEVNVDMIFGKHESGWKAVKQAYQALQPQVTVNLSSHGGSDYATAIKQELQSDNTSLGVFAGNYVNTLVPTYGYDFKANALDTKNVYAGNKIWRDVLTTQAYTMNTSSTGVDTLYVMNSQSLETCWYINVEAFKAAGITDANGDALTPKTRAVNAAEGVSVFGVGSITLLQIADFNSFDGDEFSSLLKVSSIVLSALSYAENTEKEKLGGSGNKIVDKFISYVEGNYDRDFKTADVCSEFGLTLSALNHTVKRVLGVSPHRFLIATRMKKAKELLRNTDMSVESISYLVGYEYSGHFCNEFKKNVGITPAEYRRKIYI